MKNLIGKLSIVCFVILLGMSATQAQSIKFESLEIDYGQIKQGDEGTRLFKFTNIGNAPLVITNAQGSCGCTVPSYSQAPIAPNSSSEISVRYDTNRIGAFTKTVTLTTNDPKHPTVVLTIRGTVNTPQ